MINKYLTFLLIFVAFGMNAQTPNNVSSGSFDERFPVFSSCKDLQSQDLEKCFFNEVQQLVYRNFLVPEKLKQSKYEGTIKINEPNKCEEIVWCDINNLPEDMIDFEVTAINNNLNGIKFSVVYADNEKKLTL